MAQNRIAAFPGTFDPITYGHLDVIRRGAGLFDQLVIGVSEHAGGKSTLMPGPERVELIKQLIKDLPNVRVETFCGMTVEFVKRIGAVAILRGIRTFGDFEYEFQLALANRTMSGVETVFVMASAENAFVRSTLIKEAVALGGDVSAFVPPEVRKCLDRYTPSRPGRPVGLGGEEVPSPGRKGSGLRGEGLE